MAMTVGSNKGGPFSAPNIVPLIDVLLLLIIVFMVITPMAPNGFPALIPQVPSQARPIPPEPETIIVRVLQGGKLMINQQQSDWSTLGARLSDVFAQRADKAAFVKGADDVPFEEVARAMDIMRGAGVSRIGLIAAVASDRREPSGARAVPRIHPFTRKHLGHKLPHVQARDAASLAYFCFTPSP